MKFKEKRGNTFVFELNGYDGIFLDYLVDSMYSYADKVSIDRDLNVMTIGYVPYRKIEKAVRMMQILIKDGLV